MFLSCRPFVVITTLSTSLVGVEVTGQETEVTSTPTRPVGNVVITKKDLQDRSIHILDGTTLENKGKLILTKCRYFRRLSYLTVRIRKLLLLLLILIEYLNNLNLIKLIILAILDERR